MTSSLSSIRISRLRVVPRTQRIAHDERVRTCSSSMSIAISPFAVNKGELRAPASASLVQLTSSLERGER